MRNRATIAALIGWEITSQSISRVSLCLQVKFSIAMDADSVYPHFSSRLMRVVESINDDFNELVDQVLRQLNVLCSGGSAWVLKKLICLDIKICKTKSLANSS